MDTVELHQKLLAAQDSAANLALLLGAVGRESITGGVVARPPVSLISVAVCSFEVAIDATQIQR